MRRRSDWKDYLVAFAAIATVTVAATLLRTALGLPAIALLFLLPVLATSLRGGLGAGLFAAAGSALAYNFFLLPPRFTLQVHGYDNVVAFLVLLAVAAVTTRLASMLAEREAAAQARAAASAEAANLAAALAATTLDEAVSHGLAFVAERFGPCRLLDAQAMADMPSLDAAAASWAAHNGDVTGHGTAVMAAADWTFIPLLPRGSDTVLAVAQPSDAKPRPLDEIERIGIAARMIGQARDRLQLERERSVRAGVEARAELLRNLLASLAHDLRTPLTVAIGGVEEARASNDPAQLTAARDALLRLDRTLAHLLDLARIEAGAVGVQFQPVDLIDMVQAALPDAALPDNVRIEIHVADTLPLVSADPVLLRQMLVNLLDNAGRHAAGIVEIAATETPLAIELCVRDDGPGIPVGQETAIFDRFVRSGGDDRGGSGLGLAIVKGFADAMAMPLRVEKDVRGGARFILTLAQA